MRSPLPLVVVRRAVGLLLVLGLTACSAEPTRTPHDRSSTSTGTPHHTPSGTPTDPSHGPGAAYADLARAPGALLVGTEVHRTEEGFTVAALWAAPHGHRRAIATSDDGFASGCCFRDGSDRAWRRVAGPPRRAAVGLLAGLAQAPADTVGRPHGLRAVVAGGDGATLLPFERVARSTDGGRHWTAVDVAEPGGARAYVSGQVVLPSGRLLVLLDAWSDDGPTPARRLHGLWASRGASWTAYAPWRPRLIPPPTPAPRGSSPIVSLHAAPGRGGGVVWVTTWDARLYVSADGAHTFHEIADR